MSDNDDPRKFTVDQQREFFARCQRIFAGALDELLAANTPIYCVMASLIGFASEAAAQLGMPREQFLDASAEDYDEALQWIDRIRDAARSRRVIQRTSQPDTRAQRAPQPPVTHAKTRSHGTASGIPADFDFSVLEDPEYNEDAVREDLVRPFLDSLGYKPTGPIRMIRGRHLDHPYVRLGTTTRKLTLIPDYLLLSDDRVLAVVDAKGPNENIVNSEHVEQAYSYAIHPDVRAGMFALCNGRELIATEVNSLQPILRVALQEANDRWADIERALHPRFLEAPFLRGFKPDFGIASRRLGLDLGATSLHNCRVNFIARQDDQTYTAMCFLAQDGSDYAASFDFSALLLPELEKALPQPERQKLRAALSSQPYHLYVGGKLVVDIAGSYGPVTYSHYETFIPIEVGTFLNVRFETNARLPDPLDLAKHTTRL
jgi:hypothetical protein